MQAELELPAAALKLAQMQEPVQGLEPALAELSAEGSAAAG